MERGSFLDRNNDTSERKGGLVQGQWQRVDWNRGGCPGDCGRMVKGRRGLPAGRGGTGVVRRRS